MSGIREEDIVERFIRSSGPGGQNVNKISTCVYLKHIPTGIEVKCQRERSQLLNRHIARKILAEKVENLIAGNLAKERQRLEKIKRRMRRKPKGLKLKILEEKRRHSKKKDSRIRVRAIEE